MTQLLAPAARLLMGRQLAVVLGSIDTESLALLAHYTHHTIISTLDASAVLPARSERVAEGPLEYTPPANSDVIVVWGVGGMLDDDEWSAWMRRLERSLLPGGILLVAEVVGGPERRTLPDLMAFTRTQRRAWQVLLAEQRSAPSLSLIVLEGR